MEPAHSEVVRLFNLAIEATPDRREALLEGECGDAAELKERVLAMVAAAEDDHFLTAPTNSHLPESGATVATDASPPHPEVTVDLNNPVETAGQQIDRYKLLQQIGEGGFGTVWMAEQREPVRRRVAIKIIKLGMDTKQVIARFEAERQALAMMDHPNIARVLDAGSTDTGRPFFVMEYIKGVPIVEYCDTEKLDTKARLELFTTTCQAIQHAHQKGIIHRDIKPSNVLVTLHDGKPVPKVIDFGIAKATNAELTNKTLFTEHRQMIGTPAYMSPEQAEMSGLDIDTRADIYSLGVLLYELLTGTTPFDSKSLFGAGYAEMMRVIREDEPHKPSTRLSSLGDTGTRTAQQRHTNIKKLSLVLKGDLDWIVMKCLEKDRTRRYDTATGLAADILRHLSDEPVVAGPPSAGYKLQKFMKRNRAKVVMGGVFASLLVLGVVGISAALVEAVAQRNLAAQETVDKEKALGELGVALGEKDMALRRAHDETAEKDVALRRTRVLALTMASAEAAESEPTRALLLAREAGRTAMLPAVLTQLHAAIQGSLERTIFRGHEAPVVSAAFSPSGDRVLTASQDKTARLWNLEGVELVVLRGHGGPLSSAVFSPSGDQILTASQDKTARLWNLEGEEIAVFRGDQFQFQSAAFSPSGDRILTVAGTTGSYDPSLEDLIEVGKTARLWDLEGQELAVLRGHEAQLYSASFSPSGEQIVTASKDKTARLWDLEGQELAVIRSPEGSINSALFSPSGEQILTTSDDKTTRLWDLEGQELAVLRANQAEFSSPVFSPSGDRILTIDGKAARLWDLEGKELAVLRGHETFVHLAKFSPSGDRIITGSLDLTARLWNLDGEELAVIHGIGFAPSVAFSPSGDQILTPSDNIARLWDLEGKELAVIRGHEAAVWSAVYSPSGDRILTASYDKTARIWDLEGKELAVLRQESPIFSAAFSPSGDRIVTGGGGARLWDLEGKELAVLRGHEAGVRTAVFSPSGDRILTASHDNTARIWDLEGEELAVIRHEGGFYPTAGGAGATCVTSAAFSPSGDRILTTSFDKVARIWDLDGKELAVLLGHEDSVMSAAYSPLGDRIVTASKDRTARLWDLDGKELAVLRGHTSTLMTAVFSPSGDRIITASLDATARLWDLEGSELAVLHGNSIVTTAAFSPSGDRIITASEDVRVWLVSGEDLLKLADERVSREFTQEERRRYADLIADDSATDR